MAGVLTENLVLQKTKVDSMPRVRKLNVCAAQLSDIGVLRRAVNLEVLSLSLNDVNEIGALENCRRLRELYLRKNRIDDMNQILHLCDAPYLEILNLSDNPICRDPNYRRFVVAAVSGLVRLDDVDVSPEEREEAYRVFPNLNSIAPPTSLYCEPVKGKTRVGNQTHMQGLSTSTRNNSNTTIARMRPHENENLRDRTYTGNGRRSPRMSPSRSPTKNQIIRPPRRHPESPRGLNSAADSSQYHVKRPQNPIVNRALASTPQLQIGPTETGVVQAVKVLLSELNTESLDEVRRFMDTLH